MARKGLSAVTIQSGESGASRFQYNTYFLFGFSLYITYQRPRVERVEWSGG